MIKNKIGELLDKNGRVHKVIAKQCGVSPQTFSSWVKNKTQPDLIQAAMISRILGITMDEMVEWEELK
jgi:putative transcriptional regulator